MSGNKRKITAWKGGRNARIYARITTVAKTNLLDRVMREGFSSLADWLEYQAMPHLTQRAPDGLPRAAKTNDPEK